MVDQRGFPLEMRWAASTALVTVVMMDSRMAEPWAAKTAASKADLTAVQTAVSLDDWKAVSLGF
jgi:phosphopantetheinyl transferase (holo-ACP synthase)